MAALLARFVIIMFGYALACLAASALLNLLFLGSHGLVAEESRETAVASSLVSVPLLALVIAYFAFVPALVAIVFAELLAWRDWLAYALAGGATGLAAALFEGNGAESGTFATANPGLLAAVAGAGMLAGIVYWMAAGRRASRPAE